MIWAKSRDAFATFLLVRGIATLAWALGLEVQAAARIPPASVSIFPISVSTDPQNSSSVIPLAHHWPLRLVLALMLFGHAWVCWNGQMPSRALLWDEELFAGAVIVENIRRGEAGLPFLHLVDRSAGY